MAWIEAKRMKEIEKLAVRHTIENSCRDRVSQLKHKISKERAERKIANAA
jgi:hypothetical protein